MRFPFEAHQGNRIPFQSNIPGRTFRNPPHPENATHYSAKNRVASSQALDATLAQGVSPTAGRKGTSLSAIYALGHPGMGLAFILIVHRGNLRVARLDIER